MDETGRGEPPVMKLKVTFRRLANGIPPNIPPNQSKYVKVIQSQPLKDKVCRFQATCSKQQQQQQQQQQGPWY